MKIQHLAIIFIIIIVPISLVVTSYIQTQIDTISLQTSYDIKLQTATADSIKSFQLNTINNKYSTVSSSKIRDIEAAVSTFYGSLGTELGASGYSNDELKEYIPAIVYTMYDGYYMYGQYYNQGSTKSDKYQYGLKPFVYYSCRYKKGSTDIVVNYTLDNNITIYGMVNGKFETRTGALIDPSLVSPQGEHEYTYIDNAGNVHTKHYVTNVRYGEGEHTVNVSYAVTVHPFCIKRALGCEARMACFQSYIC